MKNVFKFLLLSPIAFSAMGCNNTTPKEPKPVDVVVISGQSNAVGCTHIKCLKRSMGSKESALVIFAKICPSLSE